MKNNLAKIPPVNRPGRPPEIPEVLAEMRTGDYREFSTYSLATSFYNRAKQLGRMPTRRTVNGKFRVYIIH